MKKQFKYILFITLGVLLFNACKEDTFISDIENGDNLVAFTTTAKGVNNIADDSSQYNVPIHMMIEGPSVAELSGDYTATLEVGYEGIDPAAQATQGTHFALPTTEITFTEENNYLGVFDVTMLTEGIVAPLAVSPKFNLNVTNVTGGGNVIASGKPLTVTLNYACSSNLQGTYNVVSTRSDGTVYDWGAGVVTVTPIGVGQYQTTVIGGFTSDPANTGTPHRPNILSYGVQFSDVCGNLTAIPGILGGTYSNPVTAQGTTQVNGNSQTGLVTGDSFTLTYGVEFSGSVLTYTDVYTKL